MLILLLNNAIFIINRKKIIACILEHYSENIVFNSYSQKVLKLQEWAEAEGLLRYQLCKRICDMQLEQYFDLVCQVCDVIHLNFVNIDCIYE